MKLLWVTKSSVNLSSNCKTKKYRHKTWKINTFDYMTFAIQKINTFTMQRTDLENTYRAYRGTKD